MSPLSRSVAVSFPTCTPFPADSYTSKEKLGAEKVGMLSFASWTTRMRLASDWWRPSLALTDSL